MSAGLDSTDLEKVKYGNGETYGFTDDGKVFRVTDTQLPDGQPVQLQQVWEPEHAEAVAKSILEAVAKARELNALTEQ